MASWKELLEELEQHITKLDGILLGTVSEDDMDYTRDGAACTEEPNVGSRDSIFPKPSRGDLEPFSQCKCCGRGIGEKDSLVHDLRESWAREGHCFECEECRGECESF